MQNTHEHKTAFKMLGEAWNGPAYKVLGIRMIPIIGTITTKELVCVTVGTWLVISGLLYYYGVHLFFVE